MKTQEVEIPTLGGIAEAYRQPVGAADLVVDMRYDDLGAWRVVGGFRSIHWNSPNLFSSTAAGPVETIAWFAQHSGARSWLVWEHVVSGRLNMYAFNGTDTSWTAIDTGRLYIAGPWAKTSYLAHGNWLYFANGHDAPGRWNGRWKNRVGFDRLPASPQVFGPETIQIVDWTFVETPKAALGAFAAPTPWTDAAENAPEARGLGTRNTSTTPGNRNYWAYAYAVTYVNELGQESPPSPVAVVKGFNQAPAATAALSGGGQRGALVVIPDPPPHAFGIRLWRSENLEGITPEEQRQAQLYLHTEFDCAIRQTVCDLKPDHELGRALDRDQLGLWPVGARLMAMFKGTMFVAGMTDYPSTVRYSAPLLIEQFPEQNQLLLGDQDSGGVTGMYASRNRLFVFKTRGIYMVSGDPVAGFEVETLTEDLGAASPHAIVDVPGMGLLFVAHSGIWMIGGDYQQDGPVGKPVHVGKPIQRLWERVVNRGALVTAWAVVHHRQHEVWIQVPTWESHRPRWGFVLHYTAGAWSVRQDWPIQCMVESRDHRSNLFMGSGVAEKGVVVYSPNEDQKGAGAFQITGEWWSGWLQPGGSPFRRGQVLGVNPYVLANGRQLNLLWYLDHKVTDDNGAHHLQPAQVDTEHTEREAWGTGVWGAAYTWYDNVPVPLTIAIRQSTAAMEFQFSIHSDRMALIGVDLSVPATAEIPKLDSNLATVRR